MLQNWPNIPCDIILVNFVSCARFAKLKSERNRTGKWPWTVYVNRKEQSKNLKWTRLIQSEMRFFVHDPYLFYCFVFFNHIAHLYKGGLLFSWTSYARWLQHLLLREIRDTCELGWWEEPPSKRSFTVPALAQYSDTGAYRVQREKSAFSNWPRTGSTSGQHGILWEDLPDFHSKPKFQQKMNRVQSLQSCD